MDKTTETRNEYQKPETMEILVSFAENVLQITSPGGGGSEDPGWNPGI